MTFNQMRYVLAGVSSWGQFPQHMHVHSLPRFREAGTAIDLGCGGGLDAVLYSQFFDRVIAIDAVPRNVRHAAQLLLAAPGGNAEALLAAIVSLEAAESNKTAVVYENIGRIDLSGLDQPSGSSERGEIRDRVLAHKVQAMSCLDLLTLYEDVVYLKIDLEGSDSSCLAALEHSTKVPKWVSLEVPCLHRPCRHGREDFGPAHRVVEDLIRLGYWGFKLVAQSPFNMRCWPNRCERIAPASKESRLPRSPSFTMAGPPGPLAVDIEAGEAWRQAEEVVESFTLAAVLEQSAGERFDLHATTTPTQARSPCSRGGY